MTLTFTLSPWMSVPLIWTGLSIFIAFKALIEEETDIVWASFFFWVFMMFNIFMTRLLP